MAVTLDLLTLKIYGKLRYLCTTFVPNLNFLCHFVLDCYNQPLLSYGTFCV